MTAETFPLKTIVQERDRTKAGFVLGKWSRARDSGSRFGLQFFYDRSRMYDAGRLDRDEAVETTDLEFQYQMNPEGHEIVWGLGFRQVRDRVGDAVDSWFSPGRFTARTYNAFAQDELAWRDDSVRFTVGSKLEWNSFSGAEVQPTARLLWAPTAIHSVWTAASRAVRVPSRFEVHQYAIDDVEEEDDHFTYDFVVPPDAFKPEKLTAYETGYRFVPSTRFSVDAALFYNLYDDLQTVERGETQTVEFPIPGAMTSLRRTNAGFGTVYGAEVLAFWTVTPAVQLSGSYTRMNMRMDPTGFPHNENGERVEDLYTPNAFFARAYIDMPYGIESSSELRFVGPVTGQEVPGYVDGSVHLSRGIRSGVRLKLSADNVLHRNHGEWDEGEIVLPRAIRAGIDWRF